jgi:hypothetical protein
MKVYHCPGGGPESVRGQDWRDRRWEENFRALAAFRERTGHCAVPSSWVQEPGLYDWVLRQRQEHRKGRLAPDRVRRLEALGFEWDPREGRWNRWYEELRRYRERHGHSDVRRGLGAPAGLVSWTALQRVLFRRGELPERRRRLLERLGFEWDPREARWERRYRELKAYRDRFGSAEVPLGWAENPGLARWLNHQREAARKGGLRDDRRRKLEALGVRWALRGSSKS